MESRILLSCFFVIQLFAGAVSGLMLSTDREHSFTILSGTRTVQFTCPATSTAPPVTFRWFYKRFPADVQVELASNIHQTISGNTMIIDQLRKTDKGVFVVEAMDAALQKKSCNFSLKVAYPPTFTAPLPPDRTATDQTVTSITCPVTGVPEPTTTWLKDGAVLAPGTGFTINGTEIIFTGATRLDEGSYQCNATNHYGSVISTPVRLTVIEEVVFIAAPNSVVYLSVGEPAVFMCNVTGHPAPTLEWHKTFFPEDPVRFLPNGTRPQVSIISGPDYTYSELSYPSVTVTDHGLYECRADQLTLSKSRLFELFISAKPVIFSVHPPEVNVLLGNPYTFICNATGHPQPDITWYKNGLEIMTSAGRIQMSRGVLKILKVEGLDSGQYSCHASNSIAQVDSNVTDFFVQGLYFTKQPPTEVLLHAGESMVLNCSAAGSKFAIDITWFKNSVKIKETCANPRRDSCHVYVNGTDLHLTKIRGQDIGNFTCQAKEVGVQLEPHVLVTKTQLIILEVPKFDSLLPAVTLGKYRGDLDMICQATGVPTPTIRWFKDGFELGNDYHRKVNGSRLVFVNLVATDRGTYVCVAENQGGEKQQQTNLTIITPPMSNATVVGGYSYAIVRWEVLHHGGRNATKLEMELREVSPRTTRWVSISVNISNSQGQYVLQGLDYNATYELNVWTRNAIGDSDPTPLKFSTLSPAHETSPYGGTNKTVRIHNDHSDYASIAVVGVIGVIVIIVVIAVFVLVARYRRIYYGNGEDNQSLVNNLHESISSHSNPVYNGASHANGLELHDIKLNGETTK